MKNDELSALTRNAELDQLESGMADLAKGSWTLFQAFKEQGFSVAQSFDMVKQWQLQLFSTLRTKGTDRE